MSHYNPGLGYLAHGSRFLPSYDNKSNFVILNDVMRYDIPIMKTSSIHGTNLINSPLLSPTLSPVMGMGMPGMPMIPMPGIGIPGVYINTTSPTETDKSKKSDPQQANIYTVVTPPITNIRHITHPNQDPELRRKVVKHFYNNIKDIYFITSKFKKLLKYIIVENNNPRLVKSLEELEKNSNNNTDYSLRIKFIIKNIFSKYDLELLISKLIAKYSMLYSDDEYNMHWHNAKYRHAKTVKKAIYKKIKYKLQKKLNF